MCHILDVNLSGKEQQYNSKQAILTLKLKLFQKKKLLFIGDLPLKKEQIYLLIDKLGISNLHLILVQINTYLVWLDVLRSYIDNVIRSIHEELYCFCKQNQTT